MRLPLAAAFILLAAVSSFAEPPKSGVQQEQDRRQAVEHYDRGRDAMSSEHFEEAVTEFQAALKLDPLMTLAYFRLGQAHMALKEYAQAEQAFVACKQAYENLAGLQLSNREEVERRREEEIQELQNEIQQIQSGAAKTSAANNLTQQLEQRVAELQRNRRKSGGDVLAVPAELSVSLGSAYFRQGKMDLAETEWKTAAIANPKLGEAHNNLAALYLITSKLDDAQREVELAEKAGYHVHPRLKEDIKTARKSAN